MDTDGFYEYEKIGAEDTIRLILLQPSVDLEASIQCSLIRVTLEQCDKDVVEHYVALSYVWGDATLRRQISVDGATLDITASLDCALRHLRDQSRLLRVWADGICINQNDFEDRNHQVRMMSSIYLLARHTIIFLGPASPQSE
ncbi:HET-domain-containing protein, partial [Hyaloscypha variabilis F]